MPMGFGLTMYDKKGRVVRAKRTKRKIRQGITMKQALFEVRPFGKRVKYPWENGKKKWSDVATEGFFKFAMRPFYLSSEYPSYKKPTKKAIRAWKRKQKLAKAPALGDYLWKHGGRGAKRAAIIGGAAGFFFTPVPALGAIGGALAGLGVHAWRHPKLIKQYRATMWKQYGVKKKHIWQY